MVMPPLEDLIDLLSQVKTRKVRSEDTIGALGLLPTVSSEEGPGTSCESGFCVSLARGDSNGSAIGFSRRIPFAGSLNVFLFVNSAPSKYRHLHSLLELKGETNVGLIC